jgi:hypothetical protein
MNAGPLWKEIRLKVLVIIALFVWIVGFIALTSFVSALPLEQPISLDPAGTIDRTIWIPLRERYSLQLEFSREGHTFEELQALIGDPFPPVRAGIPVPIEWSFTSKTSGEVVANGTSVTEGASGWGREIWRNVTTIRVAPGRYVFHARVLRPVPELKSIPTKLALWNSFKTNDTWQSTCIFFGTLFAVWVCGPVLIVFLLLLGWTLARHWWRLHGGVAQR